MNTSAPFQRFSSAYRVTFSSAGSQPSMDERARRVDDYRLLMASYAGTTFEAGLYRVHNEISAAEGMQSVREGFPEFATRAVPFAFDWLGRQFALDLERSSHRQPQVLLLEPGTGEVLLIPYTLHEFHEDLLVTEPEPALANSFFEQWRVSNPAQLPIEFDKCVGYRIPLFLGGRDEVANLELTDRDVYWSIGSQLLAARLRSPKGKSVRGVSSSQKEH